MKLKVSASDISRNVAKLKEEAMLLRGKAKKLGRLLQEVEATQHEVEMNLEDAKAIARTLHSKFPRAGASAARNEQNCREIGG